MLIIDRVSHYFDQQCVLDNISFDCAPGSITCLIGASGCGKTTLLRLAAGLLELQSGQISLDGKLLAAAANGLPPEQRPVGLVFQEGALFPHMTVAENIGFGLEKAARPGRVRDLLSRVDLSGLADRYPNSLSGGQRQRVALARALATNPRALLFNEPYSNLDMQLRGTLRDDARRMVRETGTIGLFVTHDPDEVLAIGDHAVVLDKGIVVQQGTPQSLYESPASMRIAQLFGDTQTLDVTLDQSGILTPFGTWARSCLTDNSQTDGEIRIVVRPHQLRVEIAETKVRIDEIRPAGAINRLFLAAPNAGKSLIVEQPRVSESALKVGDSVRVLPTKGSIFATSAFGIANKNDSH